MSFENYIGQELYLLTFIYHQCDSADVLDSSTVCDMFVVHQCESMYVFRFIDFVFHVVLYHCEGIVQLSDSN